jgi:hypothetical protein
MVRDADQNDGDDNEDNGADQLPQLTAPRTWRNRGRGRIRRDPEAHFTIIRSRYMALTLTGHRAAVTWMRRFEGGRPFGYGLFPPRALPAADS